MRRTKNKKINKKKIAILVAVVAVIVVAIILIVTLGGKKEEPKPAPKPAPVATKEAIAEPEPEPEIYVSPFTGLPIDDTKNISRRPLSVKIENDPEAWYQMGINSADIVYETRVEGNVSRFNCIFQSNIPDEVGPVRSARLSDAWVVPQYDALLYFSGSNSEVNARLRSVKVKFGPSDTLLHRVDFKRAPHNLYLDLKGAYKAAKKNKIKLTVELSPLYYGFDTTTGGAISGSAIVPVVTEAGVSGGSLTIEPSDENVSAPVGDETSGGTDASATDSSTTDAATTDSAATDASEGPLPGFTGKPAKSLSLAFMSTATWKWSAEKGVWLRWTSDSKHLDGATEEQVYTDNVVLMYAEYPQANKVDPAGNPTYNTVLGGEGKAMLFRDGYVYECTWKADKNTPPALFDEQGKQLPLKQGKTWFEVPPTEGMDVTVK